MKITVLLLSCITAAVIIGCATKNPDYTKLTPEQQATNTTIPQYIVNPNINALSNTFSGAAAAAAPVNPYAGMTDWAIKLAFGVLGAAAAGWVTAKNKNGVIDTLASGVVKAGSASSVLDHASTTPHFTAVADAINNNTGANQTLGGTPTKT